MHGAPWGMWEDVGGGPVRILGVEPWGTRRVRFAGLGGEIG